MGYSLTRHVPAVGPSGLVVLARLGPAAEPSLKTGEFGFSNQILFHRESGSHIMGPANVLDDHVQLGALECGCHYLVVLLLADVIFLVGPAVLEVVQRTTKPFIRSTCSQYSDSLSHNTGRRQTP